MDEFYVGYYPVRKSGGRWTGECLKPLAWGGRTWTTTTEFAEAMSKRAAEILIGRRWPNGVKIFLPTRRDDNHEVLTPGDWTVVPTVLLKINQKKWKNGRSGIPFFVRAA